MDIQFERSSEFPGTFGLSVADCSTPGRLKYNPANGLELEIVNGFSDKDSLEPSDHTIFGNLHNGTPITLIKCWCRRPPILLGFKTGLLTTFYVQRAIFGSHIESLDATVCTRYSIELSSLSSWIGRPPAGLEAHALGGEKTPGMTQYPRRKEVVVSLPEHDCRLVLTQSPGFSSQPNSYTVEWYGVATAETKIAWSIDRMSQLLGQFENLFSLFVGEPVSTRRVTFSAPASLADNRPELECQMLYQQAGRSDRNDLWPHEIMLPFQEIANELPAMAQKWFSRSKQAELATNIFCRSRDDNGQSVNVRFLLATQAVESYHRSLSSGYYMKPEDYAAVAETMTAAIPVLVDTDHRASLKNRIKYGNEYSLRKRLTSMIRRLPEDMAHCITGGQSSFVTSIVDTRNYYTHYDAGSKASSLSNVDAHSACEKLRILLIANVLFDLGLSPESILPAIQRKREFVHWMSQRIGSDAVKEKA